MADQADIAARNDFTEEALARRKNAVLKTELRGRCLNCDAQLDKGLYCDADCREDYEYQQRVKSKVSSCKMQ